MECGRREEFRGHIDAVEPIFSGWVSRLAQPDQPVSFWLTIDRDQRIAVRADGERSDVAAAGLAGLRSGFAVALPAHLLDGAEHALALSLADGRALNLLGHRQRVALGPVAAELIPPDMAGAQAVRELLRQTYGESGLAPDRIGLDNAARFDAVHHGGTRLFYARAYGRLVGYGRLDRGDGPRRQLGIVALSVLEAYRRKGIGERLMRALLGAAAQDGVAEVWLSVRQDNLPARRLYEKLGFLPETWNRGTAWPPAGELGMVWRPPRPR